jgi:uncharacterized protein YkwD
VIGAALLVAALGCGARGGQPSWRKPEEVRGGPRGPVTIRFIPKTPPSRGYNDPPVTPAPSSELGDAVVREVQRVSEKLGKPAPVPDGRLFAAARELAEVAPEDLPLVYSLIEFALQRNGIIEPSPHLVVIWGPTDDAGEIVKSLADRLPTILGAADFARVGVGVADREGDKGVTILAFQSSSIDTSPIPRQLPAGGKARIEASVKAPFVQPQAFVTREDGAVERLGLAPSGAGLVAELRCGSHRGRQQIEITAEDKTGSTVLANFPVWCAEEAPTTLTVHLDADETAPIASREEAEERLVRLVNRDREKHGLAPLQLDPRLQEVARNHCEEMRETGVVAHLSPKTGSAADRVKAGGIKSSVVLENVARAYGIGEAEEGLMNSPGHRANILSRDASHMAIGVVLGEDVAGRRELFVTQLFIRKTARIDAGAVARQVRERVQQARAIDEDPRLSGVAQELAQGVAAGSSPNDASVVANKRLSGMSLPYAKVTTLVTTVADLAAFKPEQSLGDKSIRAYGAGIAQGDHDVMGEGAIHIVLLLAHK